jgi:hypothetical protein
MDNPNRPLITIGFSSHRLEVLPVIQEEMASHQAIALEEPPEEDFTDFLRGDLSADDYLADKDVEFPEFSLRQLDLVKGLYEQKKPFAGGALPGKAHSDS